jgi:hypothetical protein
VCYIWPAAARAQLEPPTHLVVKKERKIERLKDSGLRRRCTAIAGEQLAGRRRSVARERKSKGEMALGFWRRPPAGFVPARLTVDRRIRADGVDRSGQQLGFWSACASEVPSGPSGCVGRTRTRRLGQGASCCWLLGYAKRAGRTGLFCAAAQARWTEKLSNQVCSFQKHFYENFE